MSSTPVLFAGVDRALFVVALAQRLRNVGLGATFTSVTKCSAAIDCLGPLTRDDLYWAARISFVAHHDEIDRFDAVFSAVFDTGLAALPSRERRLPPLRATDEDDQLVSMRLADDSESEWGRGLPWATLPSTTLTDDEDGDDDDVSFLPERLPSDLGHLADTPFDLLDERELAIIGALIERSMHRWPTRRTRRRRRSNRGRHTELRSSLRRALRTGGEPMRLERSRDRREPRRVVALVDVSGSMESFARAYLHLTRALAVGGRAEVFAFATELTRITPSLRRRSPTDAIDRASADVGDRFGGTRLASAVAALLGNARWCGLARGAIVVIASDGWDTDPPADLDRAMRRLRRVANRVVWINPRAAAPGYEPLVGAMVVALPHCDAFVSGHSLSAIDDLVAAIVDAD